MHLRAQDRIGHGVASRPRTYARTIPRREAPIMTLPMRPRPGADVTTRGTQRPLRIAQVAPAIEQVPPAAYGGTERIVHELTTKLVEAGHDVTVFASGDSNV